MTAPCHAPVLAAPTPPHTLPHPFTPGQMTAPCHARCTRLSVQILLHRHTFPTPSHTPPHLVKRQLPVMHDVHVWVSSGPHILGRVLIAKAVNGLRRDAEKDKTGTRVKAGTRCQSANAAGHKETPHGFFARLLTCCTLPSCHSCLAYDMSDDGSVARGGGGLCSLRQNPHATNC